MKKLLLILFLAYKTASYAGVAYITDSDGNLYSLPLGGGPYIQINTSPLTTGTTRGIAISGATAYITAGGVGNVVALPLTGGTYTQLNTNQTATNTVAGIAASGNTLYVTNGTLSGQVYTLPINGGDFQLLSPAIIPTGIANDIRISNDTIFVTNFLDSVYSMPITGGSFTLVNSSPIPGPPGTARTLSIFNNTVYVTNGAGDVYAFPTTGGTPVKVNAVTIPGSFDRGIQILDGVAYITETLNGNVYAMPLNTGLFSQLNINTIANGTPWTLALFDPPAPTWNVIPTFVAQLVQTSLSLLLVDHLRFNKSRKQNPCTNSTGYYPWMEAYGEYVNGKVRHLAPGLEAGSGGVVFGMEYDGLMRNPVGVTFSYAYTHVHGKHNAGKAKINQGYVTLYGTINASDWYFDLALWGGYYNVNNYRHVDAFGFSGTAKSNPHGWQLTPHLEIGYDFIKNFFQMEPFIMADWVNNWEHSLNEHGAIGFDVHQKKRYCSLFRGEAGLRFLETFQFNWGRFVLLEKGSYAYQKTFHTGSLSAFVIDIPQTFVIKTLKTAQNLGIVELKALFLPTCSHLSISLDYQGTFGATYQSHQGMLSLGRDY